jgi:hypothetical protein
MVGINTHVHALRATAVTNALVPRCRYRQGPGVAGGTPTLLQRGSMIAAESARRESDVQGRVLTLQRYLYGHPF